MQDIFHLTSPHSVIHIQPNKLNAIFMGKEKELHGMADFVDELSV